MTHHLLSKLNLDLTPLIFPSGTVYVKDIMGDVVYIHDDMSTLGTVLPVGIGHVYNQLNVYTDTDINYGKNWRLTVSKRVSIAGDFYYYVDEDGTRHFFEKVVCGKTYRSEEDPDMILEILSNGYKISDSQGNMMEFNSTGKITKYKDIFGQVQYFHYSQGRLVRIEDGSCTTIDLHYNSSNKLEYIRKRVGAYNYRTIYYEYEGNNLKKITYPDGKYTVFFYDGSRLKQVKSYDGSEIRIDYDNTTGKCISLKRFNSAVEPEESISMSYSMDSTVSVYKYGADDSDILSSINVMYDRWGRTVCVTDTVTDETRKTLYDESKSIAKRNLIIYDSGVVQGTDNLARDPGAESTRNAGTKHTIGATGNAIKTTTKARNGRYSYQIDSSSKSGYVMYRMPVYIGQSENSDNPNVFLKSGEEYTFSAYAYVNNICGDDGAIVGFMYQGGIDCSEPVDVNISEIDWYRISHTFKAPQVSGGGYVEGYIFIGIRNATGRAYFDDLQLESGNIAGRNNLVANPGFDENRLGYGDHEWMDDAECYISNDEEGRSFMRINGKPGYSSTVYQTVRVNFKR